MLPLLRALRGRPFALLWSGQTISVIGDRIFQVALAWWVLEETGSAVAMGAVFIFTTIPMLLFLLIGGVFVDRFPRLWLMLISDVTRGLTMGLMALLAFSGTLEIWHVYVFSLVSGFVEAFFSPAYRSALPELTPAEDLPSANSLTSLSRQLSSVLGPAAGAAIVMLGGTPLSFALDGASFFISAFCLVPILKLATSPRREETSESIFANLREGLRAVMASPW
jgi:DHA3 family macrolide efflux protein-like MFS transporter